MKALYVNIMKECFYNNLGIYLDVVQIKDYFLEKHNISICNNTVHNYVRFLINIGFNITTVNDKHNKYYYIFESSNVKF